MFLVFNNFDKWNKSTTKFSVWFKIFKSNNFIFDSEGSRKKSPRTPPPPKTLNLTLSLTFPYPYLWPLTGDIFPGRFFPDTDSECFQ